MQASEASTDVIIVGAGPVGLFALCQLGVHPDKTPRFQYTTSSSELPYWPKVA